MKNADSGVALADSEGIIIDAVGWGDSSNIEQTLFTGNPCNDTPTGMSLKRISYSGNNYADFIHSKPSFMNSLGQDHDPSTNSIILSVEVRDASSYISNISFPYDSGNDVFLIPGKTKLLNITFSSNAESINATFNGDTYIPSSESDSYLLQLSLPYTFIPSNYTLAINAESSGNTYSRYVNFTILPLLAFNIDLNSINCTSSPCVVEGDYDVNTTDKPTIMNIGNKPLDFNIYADNLSAEQGSIDISSVRLSLAGSQQKQLTNHPNLFATALSPGSALPCSFFIDMPQRALAGSYSTKIVFMGASSD
jgi:hypothetical protein